MEAGTYYAENALEEDWRTTALYADETRQQVVLLTWVRSDVTPIPLDLGGGSAGEDSVEAFLDALDQMDATAGSDLGEGASPRPYDTLAAWIGNLLELVRM